MRLDRGLTPGSAVERPAAVTIGSLDGVHRGHRRLVEETVRVARESGADAVVVTFEPHPRCVLDPPSCPPTLTLLPEKEALLAALDVDRLVVLPFTRELSQLPAAGFADLVREALRPVAIVAGYDFAFGRGREGDVGFLREYGARHGIAVSQVDALEVQPGETASSSAIRTLLAAGDVRAAAGALGYHYAVCGVVEHGEKMGRQLGFPTANLGVDPSKCLPGNGVYATWVRVRDAWHPAATAVGVRPTFAGTRLTVEAYLLDFDDDIYDETVSCVFVDRLREERRYDVVDDLVAQMHRDVAQARLLLRDRPPAS